MVCQPKQAILIGKRSTPRHDLPLHVQRSK